MKYILCSLLCYFFMGTALQAQNYGLTLGVRFSNDNFKRAIGISSQQRIFPRVTLEEILQSDFQRNTTFHGLIKVHQPLLTKRLNFYMGVGISAGIEESEFVDPNTDIVVRTVNNNTFGGDMIAGVELNLLRYNLSIDYKPNFNLTGREPWFLGQAGFSLRYAIISGAAQNKRWRQRKRDKRREERQENREDSQFWNLFKRTDVGF